MPNGKGMTQYLNAEIATDDLAFWFEGYVRILYLLDLANLRAIHFCRIPACEWCLEFLVSISLMIYSIVVNVVGFSVTDVHPIASCSTRQTLFVTLP